MTNPANGIHAINLLTYQIAETIGQSGNYPEPTIWRCSPVTTVEYNYDKLNIPQDSLSRSPKYTRYLPDGRLLRTQTSAIAAEIVPHLKSEQLALMPGIIYRRDVTDKTHVGEPHQIDIWQISEQKLGEKKLVELIDLIVNSTIKLPYRLNKTEHPYTYNGVEIEVLYKGNWLEVGEAGIAHQSLLQPNHYGLAMGWGLDRLAMIIKEIDDIRLLRHTDPRIANQMTNLEKYQPISNQPSVKRDLSLAVNQDLEIEDISEQILNALSRCDRSLIESIEIINETNYEELPEKAIKRLRMSNNQKNILVRITMRSSTNSLTSTKCNKIREKIYRKLIKINN